LQADYVTVVEDRPIMSAKYNLPVIFGQNWPTQQSRGLFATAKLLVELNGSECQRSDIISFPLLFKAVDIGRYF